MIAATVSGMLSSPGYFARSAADRGASDAPMFTRSSPASVIPVPDPVAPDVIVTFGFAVL